MKSTVRKNGLRLAILCLAAVLAISCASKPDEAGEDNLLGVWANREYYGGAAFRLYRFAYRPDGTTARWNYDTPAEPSRVGRWVIEKKWTDADGSTWYRIEETWSGAEFSEETLEKWFTLARIDKAGDTLECQSSMSGFPEALAGSPAEGGHGIYYRQ